MDKILVVDDDPAGQHLLRVALVNSGYEVETAGTGQEALEKARGKSFKMALLDIKLPDVEGVDLLAPLREMHPDLAVIMVTAYSSTENAVRALEKGADAYLVKPLNINEMLTRVKDILEKQRLMMEKRQAEDALRENKERLDNFMNSATDGFTLFDSNLNCVDINKAALDMTGLSKEEVTAKNILDVMPNLRETDRYDKYLEVIKTGKPVSMEDVVSHPEFGDIYLTVKAFRVGDGLGIITTDTTERRKMQTQLVQAEKLSAIGTMAAGIAHEMLDPMMGMLNFAQYCLEHTAKDDLRYPILQDIERETRRCADIVRNLLTFSYTGNHNEEYQKNSLATIIERVVRLLSYRIEKQHVSLTQHIDEATPEVWMKTSSLQQVFLNLIGNALDAVEEAKKKEIRVKVHCDGELVEVIIADSGCGISPKNLGKIFDPFFTTKPVGQGTGLGLTLSRNIILEHGGDITCESKHGAGTTFKILLPVKTKGGVK